MLKSRKQLLGLELVIGSYRLCAVFNIKSHGITRHELYNCNFLSTSFRIDYLSLICCIFLKTCSFNDVLKVCVSVTKYDAI